MEAFPLRLRQCRRQKRLTQQAAAQALGIAFSTYRRYERGETEPVLSDALHMALFFGVSLDYLAGRTDFPAQMG